ncbi:hypothetical protein RB594_005049 [Gaeumannomyces avenae]
MSDQVQEILDVPREFLKDGLQFINRSQKRQYPRRLRCLLGCASANTSLILATADRKEFLKICQAVGVGFLVMGAVGYVVKLIHIPLNNILVGGA